MEESPGKLAASVVWSHCSRKDSDPECCRRRALSRPGVVQVTACHGTCPDWHSLDVVDGLGTRPPLARRAPKRSCNISGYLRIHVEILFALSWCLRNSTRGTQSVLELAQFRSIKLKLDFFQAEDPCASSQSQCSFCEPQCIQPRLFLTHGTFS